MQPIEESKNPYAAPRASSDDWNGVSEASSLPDGSNLFRTIWTHPRLTVREIVLTNPALHVTSLACLAGIGQALDRASMRSSGDSTPLITILGVACVIGPLAGLFNLWIGSHLLKLTGNWIGGIASREHLKTAIAWGSVPAIATLPLWIPQLLLFGSEMFTSATPTLDAQPMLLIPFLLMSLVELVFGIWSLVLMCNTIAEVQGFRSAWRGLGNAILAFAVIFLPILLLVFAVIAAVQIS